MMDWLYEHGSLVVLLVFFAMFLAFGFWAYRPANKAKMKNYGEIPLRETGNGE